MPPALPRPAARGPRRALATLLLALAGAATAGPPPPAPSLPAAVADALRRAQVPPDALGAVVLPVVPPGPPGPQGPPSRAGPRWQHLAERPMPPASTMKLLTSIVALDRLGPNHRGFTELLTRAPQQGEVLAGDLILRGGADPELDLARLWALLAELRDAHGVREIAGDIVLDRQLFRPALPPPEPPFDQHPEFPYNVAPDALQPHGGVMGLELRSGADGAVSARALPPLPGVTLDAAAMRPSERDCAQWRQDWRSPPERIDEGEGRLRIALQGGFPRGCTQRAWLQLMDRSELLQRQLRVLWTELGGRWRGRVREADAPLLPPLTPAQAAALAPPPGTPRPATTEPPPPAAPRHGPGTALAAPGVAWGDTPGAAPADTRLLARHLSRPWGELLRAMNKASDNALARLQFLSLGLAAMAEAPDQPTLALARRAVLQWLAEQRIPTEGVVLDNGSGLSRSDRIGPLQLALALQVAHQGRWAPELLTSLPLAGVDGTLRNRLRSGPAAGSARLKTGALRDVASVAGYVPDTQGRWWVLVAIVHHEQAGAARPALDALVDWVARGGAAGAGGGLK